MYSSSTQPAKREGLESLSKRSTAIQPKPIFLCFALVLASHVSAAQGAPSRPTAAKSMKEESSQALPLLRIPAKLNKNDEQAIALISQITIVPMAKRIFPDYRPRAYDENENPISAWTVQQYHEIAALQSLSEPLRQLPISQLMAMESKLGGVNKHGMLTDLKSKTTETYQDAESINIDPDNAGSLLAAMPPSWHSVAERVNKIKGNHSERFEIAPWKATFGDAQTKKVLEIFSNLEREKGRPREVWAFALADDDWEDKLSSLKKQLQPLGYEAYALEKECRRTFFSSRIEAETYAKKLKPGTASTVIQEGPAELIIDNEANVISTSGQVVRRDLDAAAKKRCEELENQSKFLGQVLSFLGMKDIGNTHKFVGIRFQFNNYPTNWIPAQAKIEKLPKSQLKITVPPRFAVATQVREAFAAKDLDQYKYLVAQGITAINYGMSGKDVITQLKRWDKQYKLSVLQANWDLVRARLEKMPPDLPAFEQELKQFCPSAADGYDLQVFKNQRILSLWWD